MCHTLQGGSRDMHSCWRFSRACLRYAQLIFLNSSNQSGNPSIDWAATWPLESDLWVRDLVTKPESQTIHGFAAQNLTAWYFFLTPVTTGGYVLFQMCGLNCCTFLSKSPALPQTPTLNFAECFDQIKSCARRLINPTFSLLADSVVDSLDGKERSRSRCTCISCTLASGYATLERDRTTSCKNRRTERRQKWPRRLSLVRFVVPNTQLCKSIDEEFAYTTNFIFQDTIILRNNFDDCISSAHTCINQDFM